jgi:hypothetical protein
MQCASSTATSDTPERASASEHSLPASVSGVVMTSSDPPSPMRSTTARRARPRTVPSRRTQGTPWVWSLVSWSRSRASSGDTSTTGRGSTIEGIW